MEEPKEPIAPGRERKAQKGKDGKNQSSEVKGTRKGKDDKKTKGRKGAGKGIGSKKKGAGKGKGTNGIGSKKKGAVKGKGTKEDKRVLPKNGKKAESAKKKAHVQEHVLLNVLNDTCSL